jgi:hypothetical protein
MRLKRGRLILLGGFKSSWGLHIGRPVQLPGVEVWLGPLVFGLYFRRRLVRPRGPSATLHPSATSTHYLHWREKPRGGCCRPARRAPFYSSLVRVGATRDEVRRHNRCPKPLRFLLMRKRNDGIRMSQTEQSTNDGEVTTCARCGGETYTYTSPKKGQPRVRVPQHRACLSCEWTTERVTN